MGATGLEQSASGGVLRISATTIQSERRAQYISEEISSRLVGARATALREATPSFDYDILDTGPGSRVIGGRLRAFDIERTRGHVSDGDDGLSLFVPLSGQLLIEQNDQRITVPRDSGVLVNHGRPIFTRFARTRFAVLQLARPAIGLLGQRPLRADPLQADPTRVLLLRSYMLAALQQGLHGPVPDVVGHHLRELVAALFRPDADPSEAGSPDAKTAARVEAMCACIRRRFADPMLTMATVAAQVGLSERSGYLVFESAQRRFSDELNRVRLRAATSMLRTRSDRVLDIALAVGFNDVSYFNRCFRKLYGCTPSDFRRATYEK